MEIRCIAAIVAGLGAFLVPVGTAGGPASRGAVPVSFAAPRVTWIENAGQWPTEAVYVGRLGGALVRAEPWAVLVERRDGRSGRGVLVKLAFEGARPGIVPEGLEREPGTHSFFLGADPAGWHVALPSFAKLRYRELYEGIDLVLRQGAEGLEYDLLVAPGADLSQVVVRCEGGESLRREDDGTLVLDTALGPMIQPVGRSWEVLPDGTRRPIEVGYRLLGEGRFGLEAAARDPELSLVVDPELLWSTYLGGTGRGAMGDTALAVAMQPNGDVTVAGVTTDSGSFPTTPGAFQGTAGAFGEDVFVTRLTGGEGHLIYSCVIGGQRNERPGGVALDGAGRAAVVGWTFSDDFPVTPGAFATSKQAVNDAAFVLRLSAAGDALEYATYLEGSNGSKAYGVALLDSGQAIVGGEAYSGDFPVTPGAFQTIYMSPYSSREGFITRFDPTGSSLEWSTFLGGSSVDRIFALATDDSGVVTVAGETNSPDFPVTPGAFDTQLDDVWSDAFVARVAADGGSLVWSTFLGGGEADTASSIALEASGGVAVGGWTASPDFPVTPGAFQSFNTPAFTSWPDGFASRLSADGATLVSSTCIGSHWPEYLTGLAVDASGLVTAVVSARDTFPATPGAFNTVPSGFDDIAVCRFDPGMTRLLYSTLLGGPLSDQGYALAMSKTGRVTVVGSSNSGYPTTPGSLNPRYNGGTRDAVITTFDLVLEGIEQVGRSKPSCLGPVALNATEMPVAGSASFAFYASGAPPLAAGWLVLGPTDLAPHAPVLAPTAPGIGAIPVLADDRGYAETPYPLSSATRGEKLQARYLFRNPPGCPGEGAWSFSNGLLVTVQ